MPGSRLFGKQNAALSELKFIFCSVFVMYKKYQISLDGMEKSVEIKEIKESESADTMQAMPWDAVLEMVNALDFDTIAEPEDDTWKTICTGADRSHE